MLSELNLDIAIIESRKFEILIKIKGCKAID